MAEDSLNATKAECEPRDDIGPSRYLKLTVYVFSAASYILSGPGSKWMTRKELLAPFALPNSHEKQALVTHLILTPSLFVLVDVLRSE